MKKTIVIRILVVALIAISMMAVTIPAFAASGSLTLSPGSSDRYLFNISSSTSYYVYLPDSVPAGSIVSVRLDYNDLEDLDSSGNPTWKKTASATVVKGGNNYVILRPTLFHFVSGRTTKARIKCTASSNNTTTVRVIFNDY